MVCSNREGEAAFYRLIEDAVVTGMAMVGVALGASKGQGERGSVLWRARGS